MLLYIVRHGEPIYVTDSLTEHGQKQAEALADRFALNGLDRIFSSPMGRAQATAKPTADRLGLKIKTLPWTREIWPQLALPWTADIWDDTDLIKPAGDLRFAMQLPGRYLRSEENHDLGERWHELDKLSSIEAKKAYEEIVVANSDKFLKTLGYQRERDGVYKIIKPNDERVAVFCHAGFTLTWLPHLLAIPPHLFWAAFDITHSSVTLLEFKDDGKGYAAPKCLYLSDMSHILQAGLPYRYNNELPI